MKKVLYSLLLSFCLLLSAETMWAAETEVPTEEEVYESMIALQEDYPEGMKWDNSDYASFNGIDYMVGYGCAGFAFILSDAAFGDLPAVQLDKFDYADIKVGDILRFNDNTDAAHSVVVLKRNTEGVVIAEGNYVVNGVGTIHWGRELSKDDVLKANYVMNRYQTHEHEWDDGTVTQQPTCEAGIKTYNCDTCMAITEELINPVAEHVYEEEGEKIKDPTCSAYGQIKYDCTVCGWYYKIEYIEKLEHTKDSGTITTAPTCTKVGVKDYHCSVCSEFLESEFVDALGHDYKSVVTAPTETEKGYTTYTCTRCNDSYKDNYVDALGKPNTGGESSGDDQTEEITGEWVKIGNYWYFYSEGRLVTSCWLNDGGTWYYLRSDGRMVTGWLCYNGTWYYMNSSGAMQTGWVWDGYNWYYMNGSGAMQTGWVWDGYNWYYMNGSGAMVTGWVWDGNSWYYMHSSGAMATGWVWDGSNWYYMHSSGAMATGWIYDGNAWYYLYSSGAMASNTWIGSYYVNASGAWVQ